MIEKIRKPLLRFALIYAVVYLMGRLVEKRMTSGDEESDDFQVAAICNGKEFHSRARNLRSGTVIAGLGGIEMDLRGARLDPAGATLDLNSVMGGIRLTVPRDWAVEVDTRAIAGGVDANVTPPDDLPVDAPSLRVRAVAWVGGTLVTTET